MLPFLEYFRNIRKLFESRERWLFLKEKPLSMVLSVYTNSDNAIAGQRPGFTEIGRIVCELLLY
jgi:hypothetical protein